MGGVENEIEGWGVENDSEGWGEWRQVVELAVKRNQ